MSLSFGNPGPVATGVLCRVQGLVGRCDQLVKAVCVYSGLCDAEAQPDMEPVVLPLKLAA